MVQKWIKFSIHILVLIISVGLYSCNRTIEKEKLVRTWYFDHFEYNPEPKEQMPDDIIQEYRDSFTLSYLPNGLFETRFGSKLTKGKWIISDDGKLLTIKNEQGRTQTYKVEEISADHFKFTTNIPAGTMTFYMNAKK